MSKVGNTLHHRRVSLLGVFLAAHTASQKKGDEGDEEQLAAAKEALMKFLEEEEKKGGVTLYEKKEETLVSVERAFDSLKMIETLQTGKLYQKMPFYAKAIGAHTAVIRSFILGDSTSSLARDAHSAVRHMMDTQFEKYWDGSSSSSVVGKLGGEA